MGYFAVISRVLIPGMSLNSFFEASGTTAMQIKLMRVYIKHISKENYKLVGKGEERSHDKIEAVN